MYVYVGVRVFFDVRKCSKSHGRCMKMSHSQRRDGRGVEALGLLQQDLQPGHLQAGLLRQLQAVVDPGQGQLAWWRPSMGGLWENHGIFHGVSREIWLFPVIFALKPIH